MRLIDANTLGIAVREWFIRSQDGYMDEKDVLWKISKAPTVDMTDTNVGSKWIPCSERLPEIGTCVMVSSIHGVAEGCRKFGYWTQFRWSAELKHDDVFAWMPLPDPFMEVKE